MGYDPFTPIAPALINVFCLPATLTPRDTFERYITWLQTCAAVLPYDSLDEKGETHSSGKTNQQPSSLLLAFNTDFGSRVLQHTSFFEPNRCAQVAIGLADGSTLPEEADALATALQQAQSDLKHFLERNDQPKTQGCLLVFGATTQLPGENLIFVPSIEDKVLPLAVARSLTAFASSAISRAIEELQSREAELPCAIIKSDRLNGAEPRRDPRSEGVRSQSAIPVNGRTSSPTQSFGLTQEDSQGTPAPGKIVAFGLLQLQAGAWSRALEQLVDGARIARDVNDPAWHAKALEGILVCMLLHAWAGMSFTVPQNCYPTSRALPSTSSINNVAEANRTLSDKAVSSGAAGLQALNAMLPALVATTMNLYERATIGYGDGLPLVLVCEARVRLTRLLVMIRKNRESLTPAALNDIVGRTSPNTNARSLGNEIRPLALSSSLLGSSLVESIVEAQSQLPLQSASSICLAVCHSMSMLQIERKQGFYLKEILQRLPPALTEARKVGAAEAAVYPSSTGLTAFSPVDKSHARVAEGVRALLQLAVRVYGLPQLLPEQGSDKESVLSRLASWFAVFSSGDIAMRLEILRLCIRVSDALPDWEGSVHFMALLLFASRQNITLAAGLPNAVPLIAAEEQTRLLNGMQHTSSAARKLGLPVLADYWDDFLVRRVELHEHSSAGKLMPHSSQDLSLTTVSGTEMRDPFIYNPFSGVRSSSGPLILVKDELASFDVVLQNPLEVDIEIESICLSTEGCRFTAHSHNVVLGPLCVQVFTLKGIPKEVGNLKITGCKAQIKYCHARSFSIFPDKWRPPQDTKRKLRKSSLADYPTDLNLPATTILDLKIINPLPRLRISGTSLVQKSVMLLEGETCTFKVTLDNPGDIPADLVLFGYQDSVTRQLQDALSANDLQPADMFELQHQLTARPAIKRLTSNGRNKPGAATSSIGAHSKQTFEFQILGKAGLTEIAILIDYAFLGKPRSEVESTFHTRQLRFTVSVTVNASVDVPRCNILSMPAVSRRAGHQGAERNGEVLAKILDSQHPTVHEQDQCILQLDLRSIWPNPVHVMIETLSEHSIERGEPQWQLATSQTLQLGLVERVLLLLPKIFVDDPFAPIPSLDNKRQFVVSASKVSLEAEMASRETFWYREKLCQRVRISWKEEHGNRQGILDVRKGMRLSARMIDALKVDHVQISFELHAAEEGSTDDTVTQKGPAEFCVNRNSFARLVVKVHNLTSKALKLLLRLQPSLHNQPHNVAMDLSKKFVWSGVLQRVLSSPLKPRETKQADLGIVALVAGSYEINATVEEIRSRARQPEFGLAEVGATAERRIWHARRPCLIHATDEPVSS